MFFILRDERFFNVTKRNQRLTKRTLPVADFIPQEV